MDVPLIFDIYSPVCYQFVSRKARLMMMKKLILTILAMTLIFLAGCQKVPPRTGYIERRIEGAGLSSKQLRLLLNDFVFSFSDSLEEAADQIIEQTADLEVKHNALLWKINGIPAGFRAAAREDPLGALLDVWVLCEQMSVFFEDGAGSTLFGPSQMIAIQASRELKEEIREIARTLAPTDQRFQNTEDFVNSFVTQTPLENLYFSRESVLKELIEEVESGDKALMAVVGDVTENLLAIQELLIIYADHLPKQVRWQAQDLLSDVEQLPSISKSLEEFTDISEAIARLTLVAEGFQRLVETERRILLEELTRERIQSFEDLDDMRLATLQYIQSERIAMLETIREERIASFEEIDKERELLTRDIQNLTLDTMNQLIGHTRELVDHFFWRALQLGALFLIVIVVFILIGRRLFK